MKGNQFYKEIKKYLKKKPKVILDIGSFNARDAVLMAKECPNSKVFAFECNPKAIELCERHIKESKVNVVLEKMAVSKMTGETCFFQASWDAARGASSIYDSSGLYDKILPFNMKKIKVNSTRIDDWAKTNNIENIDIVWADVQGAEVEVFESFGDLLKNVKVIHSEVLFKKIYNDCSLYEDLKKLLERNGFVELSLEESPNGYWTDVIYVNGELV